jgi:molybdenum cofactor cytidylyltransferase
VLAAGLSSRMGSPKALLPLEGRPLLLRILSEVLISDLDRIILVYGPKGNFIRQILQGITQNPKLDLVYNPAFRQGISTSIKRGLNKLRPETKGLMFLMGDQPFLKSSVINRLIKQFLKGSNHIVVPYYGQRTGNPVIFPNSFVTELQALEGDTGGRQVIRRHPERVLPVQIRPLRIGWDMDTPEDYEKIKEYFNEKN